MESFLSFLLGLFATYNPKGICVLMWCFWYHSWPNNVYVGFGWLYVSICFHIWALPSGWYVSRNSLNLRWPRSRSGRISFTTGNPQGAWIADHCGPWDHGDCHWTIELKFDPITFRSVLTPQMGSLVFLALWLQSLQLTIFSTSKTMRTDAEIENKKLGLWRLCSLSMFVLASCKAYTDTDTQMFRHLDGFSVATLLGTGACWL